MNSEQVHFWQWVSLNFDPLFTSQKFKLPHYLFSEARSEAGSEFIPCRAW